VVREFNVPTVIAGSAQSVEKALKALKALGVQHEDIK
jgi:hypothetical protein